jgi:hypothetical protein
MAIKIKTDREEVMARMYAHREPDREHMKQMIVKIETDREEVVARMDAHIKVMLEKWTPNLKESRNERHPSKNESHEREEDRSQYECLAGRDDARP